MGHSLAASREKHSENPGRLRKRELGGLSLRWGAWGKVEEQGLFCM